MLLEIKTEVFTTGDRFTVAKLLDLAMTGRHDWRPDKATAESAVRFAELLPFRSVKEFVQQALVEASKPGGAEASVAVITVEQLKELLADLSRPAVLVVEDEINEGCFLVALAEAFGESRILRALQEDWLALGHAGGKDRMEQFVARRRQQFSVLIRVAALMDSDRKHAGHRTRNDTYAARILAIDGITELHMWECRELENYIPCRAWEESFPGRAPKVDALRRMSAQKRRYLDVKEHFGGKAQPLIPDGIGLTEDDFAELGPDAVAELRELLAMIYRIL
ncbi:hypothetical protein [Micromonospora sp. NPDC048830]|uniref:hypothetical protein n=1 Tax=Micromonospora sp. NPDC048830 TaxID=3364257 RepID=UPI003710FB6F